MNYFALVFLIFILPCHATIEVEDYSGNTLQLDKPAERIIALAPHIVENLYTAGAGSKVIGAVDYCDYPLEAKKIPRVGLINAYSIETIISLKPDLVIAWDSGFGGKAITKLRRLGLKVYADNPLSLDDISRSIKDFAILAGTSVIANQHSAKFDETKQRLQNSNRNKQVMRVFYEVWNKPLQTLNGEHIVSDIIRLCGGENVFSDEISLAPKVSIESILQVNPQVIIASGIGDSRPQWLDEWLRWPNIAAVKTNSLYFIPPDQIQRNTVRILEGADLLCKQLDDARSRL